MNSPRKPGDIKEVTNIVRAPPPSAPKREITPWELWGNARATDAGQSEAAEGVEIKVTVGKGPADVSPSRSEHRASGIVHVPVSATMKRRVAAQSAESARTSALLHPQSGSGTQRSTSSIGEPRGNAILAALSSNITRETLASTLSVSAPPSSAQIITPLHQHLHSASSTFRSLVPQVSNRMPWGTKNAACQTPSDAIFNFEVVLFGVPLHVGLWN